ncbi:MAG: helix-turn-helix transcriptional regulator [Actinobacteria bacterium]|nr:helix-turn-helix transcriptional regulator [Actinomycetota bacterium]
MTDNINKIADFFKALGDTTRIKILKLLLLHNNLCVGMIAYKLNITQPAVSQHLKILKTSGIVEGKRTGFNIHYSIKEDVFKKFGIELAKIIKIKEGNSKLENKSKNLGESV